MTIVLPQVCVNMIKTYLPKDDPFVIKNYECLPSWDFYSNLKNIGVKRDGAAGRKTNLVVLQMPVCKTDEKDYDIDDFLVWGSEAFVWVRLLTSSMCEQKCIWTNKRRWGYVKRLNIEVAPLSKEMVEKMGLHTSNAVFIKTRSLKTTINIYAFQRNKNFINDYFIEWSYNKKGERVDSGLKNHHTIPRNRLLKFKPLDLEEQYKIILFPRTINYKATNHCKDEGAFNSKGTQYTKFSLHTLQEASSFFTGYTDGLYFNDHLSLDYEVSYFDIQKAFGNWMARFGYYRQNNCDGCRLWDYITQYRERIDLKLKIGY